MRWNFFPISLIIIVLATSAFRLVGIANKQILTHDEGISYLSATCHQGKYSQVVNSSLVGNWVQASEWKKLIRPDEFFCFQRIGFDLAHYDIHPPLYFWLLHIWTFLFGVSMWSGPSLNILITDLTILALFALALRVLGNISEATLVVFSWAINPSIILVSTEARQYDLLTLWAVLLVWQTVRYSTLPKPIKLHETLFLMILTIAGLLTHYYFLFVVVGVVIFSIARLIRKDNQRLIGALVAIGLGHILAIALHPDFVVSFQGYNQYQKFVHEEFFKRVEVVLLSFSSFFYLFVILLGVVIWAFITYFYNRSGLFQHFRNINLNELYIPFICVWLGSIIIVLYLTFLSPQHSMGPKYLSLIWPFFVFIVAYILRFTNKFKLHLTIFFYVCPLILVIAAFVDLNRKNTLSIPFDQADFVIIDNLARGILPRIIWHVPDDSFVLVDTQQDILRHPENWLNRLTDRSIYVSHLAYGNSLEQTKATLKLIGQTHEYIVVEQGIWDIGYIIKIETSTLP